MSGVTGSVNEVWGVWIALVGELYGDREAGRFLEVAGLIPSKFLL